jgi:hypothetical protein
MLFKRMSVFGFTLVLMSIVAVTASLAQGECPDLVQQALEYTDETCTGIERNQACYGNAQIEAAPQADVTDFSFSEPGDIADITAIQSLTMSAMDTPDVWGVMMMSVQANLPDTLPGQNVTMLLFGELEFEDQRVAELPTVNMEIRKNARIRGGPGTEFAQVGSARNGDKVVADGRNEAATWIRIKLEDGGTGWVLGDTTAAEGPVASLAVLDETLDATGLTYGPMQAFYFTSGVGNPQCDEAPEDGILIQTPSGAGKISLVVNGVFVEVGSTIYLRGQTSNTMRLAVLDGEARATLNGRSAIAPAGTQISVALDGDGKATGDLTLEVYEEDDVTNLPVQLLPEEITIAKPLTAAELAEVLEKNRTPLNGEWRLLSASCGEKLGEIIPITFEVDGAEMLMVFFGSEMPFSQVEGGTYSDGTRSLYVLSPEYIESQNNSNGCSISLQLVGG